MSRVFDLLDNIKNEPDAKGIHPALKEAVFASKARDMSRKRYLVLVLLAVASVVAGAGVRYYLAGMESSRPPVRRQVQRLVPPPAPSSSAANQPPKGVAAAQPAPSAVSDPAVMKMPAVVVPPEPQAKPNPVRHERKRQERLPLTVPPVEKRRVNDIQPQKDAKPQAKDPAMRDRYLLLAREMEEKREFEQAIKYYRLVLEMSPDNYRVLNNLAGLYLQTGRPLEATAAAQRALGIKRDFLPALINMGISQAKQGNEQQAMLAFARAFSLDPANKGVMYNMALLQERSGKLDESVVYYRRLAEGGDVQGMLGVGRICEKQRKWGEAIKAYRDVLSAAGALPGQRKTAEERLEQLAP